MKIFKRAGAAALAFVVAAGMLTTGTTSVNAGEKSTFKISELVVGDDGYETGEVKKVHEGAALEFKGSVTGTVNPLPIDENYIVYDTAAWFSISTPSEYRVAEDGYKYGWVHGQAAGGIPVTTSYAWSQGEDINALLTVPIPEGYNTSSAKYNNGTNWVSVDSYTDDSITFSVSGCFADYDAFGTIYQLSGGEAFEIKPSTDISTLKDKATIPQESYAVTGSAITPEITIPGLTKDTDYTVSYSNNTNIGTATITVKGRYAYYGSFTKTFQITAIDISTLKDKATIPQTSYTQTGSAIEPEVTIPGLTKGTDFTVAYSDNVNSGTATITVTGCNNYTGSFTINFTITVPATGTVTADSAGTASYKVTAADDGNVEVSYESVTDKNTKKVSIPDTVTLSDGTVAKVTSVSNNAFKGSTKITNVTIGNNVETIGKAAFKNCKNLKTVSIGKSVTKIDKNAFSGTKKLNKVTIKSTSITSIGKNAFKNTKSSLTIKVPAKKLNAYKKLIKKSGASSSIKIKK